MSQTQEWLDGYVRAWRSKDAADVRAIFTDDAEYLFQPDDPEPALGIDAIVEMWADEERSEPQFAFEVLIEDERLGIIKGHVDYPGYDSYSNLWEVWFAPDGRAKRFVEWYMKRGRPTAA
ncbi:nuclear transport factor 2 family protein [Microbacterium sp.]|uniref:nuclear transport factor 2 family protein n=1 Tax=Microbacterium sp. TaxID=51671 RepID=UPI003A920CF0